MIIISSLACLFFIYKVISILKALDKKLISKKIDKELRHARQLQRQYNEKMDAKKSLLLLDKNLAASEARLQLQLDEEFYYSCALSKTNDEAAKHWTCESYVYASIVNSKILKIQHELYFKNKIQELLSANEANFFENGMAFDKRFKLTDYIIHHILGYKTLKVAHAKCFANFKRHYQALNEMGFENIILDNKNYSFIFEDNVFIIKLNNEIILQFSINKKELSFNSHTSYYEASEISVFKAGYWIIDFLNINRELLLAEKFQSDEEYTFFREQEVVYQSIRNSNFRPIANY